MSISLIFVIAASLSAGEPSKTPESMAGLKFVSGINALNGTVYGIDAIDNQSRIYGQRMTANFSAGYKTVQYKCPNSPTRHSASQIGFTFEAGQQYELVCQAKSEAIIRKIENC
jgi:hypothetical protein